LARAINDVFLSGRQLIENSAVIAMRREMFHRASARSVGSMRQRRVAAMPQKELIARLRSDLAVQGAARPRACAHAMVFMRIDSFAFHDIDSSLSMRSERLLFMHTDSR
jgi:hypothetical protein